MPANRYAVANSTNPTLTSAWSATRGGASGASVPVTGDSVWVEEPVNWGTQTMEGGGTVDLASLVISTPGSITNWTVSCSAGTVVVNTPGNKVIGLTAGAAGFGKVKVDSTGTGQLQLLGGTLNGVADGLGRSVVLEIGSGCNVFCETGLAFASSSKVVKKTGGQLVMKYHATQLGTLLESGGSTRSERRIDVAESSGTLTMSGTAITTAIGTRMTVLPGGHYIQDTPATVAFIEVRPGAEAVSTMQYAFTVTASEKWEGASLFERVGTAQATYTADPVLIGAAG